MRFIVVERGPILCRFKDGSVGVIPNPNDDEAMMRGVVEAETRDEALAKAQATIKLDGDSEHYTLDVIAD
ncbi:MAG: hypothetical protein EP329_14890 [Deltaproteobacteria bacterium]|nr:MAG: hypothetical protein EP329_14890 [Deltaproteobacteria bacterium]